MATRDAIVNAALSRLRDPNHLVWSCAQMNDYVQDGYDRVIGASPYWPFKDTSAQSASQLVAANANTITLPTDAFRVKSVFNVTDKVALRELTGNRSYAELYPDQAETPGIPLHYRIFNNTVLVYPFAAVATQLKVEYFATPAALTASTSPVFPSQYHGMLIEYAMAMAYQDDDAPQQAAAHMVMFETRLQEMKTDLLGATGDSYHQINDDQFS